MEKVQHIILQVESDLRMVGFLKKPQIRLKKLRYKDVRACIKVLLHVKKKINLWNESIRKGRMEHLINPKVNSRMCCNTSLRLINQDWAFPFFKLYKTILNDIFNNTFLQSWTPNLKFFYLHKSTVLSDLVRSFSWITSLIGSPRI